MGASRDGNGENGVADRERGRDRVAVRLAVGAIGVAGMGGGYRMAVTGRREGLGEDGDSGVPGPDQGGLGRDSCEPLYEAGGWLGVSARTRPCLVVGAVKGKACYRRLTGSAWAAGAGDKEGRRRASRFEDDRDRVGSRA